MSALPPARVLEVEPAEYHKLPGFSASLAKILIGSCAAKARDAWERRAEKLADEDEGVSDDKRKRLETGAVLDALVLGKGKVIEVVPTDVLAKNGSYGTKESKALRDAARAAGRIPVKEPEMPIYERSSDAIKARLAAAGHKLDGISQLAIEWHEASPHGPVQCRAMLDHVVGGRVWNQDEPRSADDRVVARALGHATHATIFDLKIVGDAHPDRCERTAENLGYAIQAAAYKRALAALYPRLAGRMEFRFLFCEPGRPYLFWDPPESGVFRELGERRWLRAVRAWGEGLATGRWPDYRTPDRVEITVPMWTLKQEGFQPEEF